MVDLIPFYKDSLKLAANLTLNGDKLIFSGFIDGKLETLIIPGKKEPERKYDLWEATCFELFIMNRGQKDYIEFNFAPSGDWNSFYVSSYRKNEGEYQQVQSVVITTDIGAKYLELTAEISIDQLPYVEDISEEFLCGFTSVTQSVDKSLNYWALTHPKGHPDFHHQDSFLPYRIGSK